MIEHLSTQVSMRFADTLMINREQTICNHLEFKGNDHVLVFKTISWRVVAHNHNSLKFLCTLIMILMIQPGHKFAHDTTDQLSQNLLHCDLTWSLYFKCKYFLKWVKHWHVEIIVIWFQKKDLAFVRELFNIRCHRISLCKIYANYLRFAL